MQKNNYIFANFKTILSNKFIQIFSIITLLIFGYFCSTLDSTSGYYEALAFGLTYQQFITLCLLPLIILSTVFLLDLFEKSTMVIIRFKDKKRYLKELLKNVWVTTSFIYLILLLVILTFLNLFSNADLSIRYIETFKTTNLMYVIYIVIKLYILILLFSFIFTFLFKLLNKTWAVIIAVLFSGSLYIAQWGNEIVVDKIYKMPFYFGNYFLDTTYYSTFGINVLSFLIMFIVLSIFTIILYKLTLKKMKAVGV